MNQNDIKTIIDLASKARKLPDDSLKLPCPRRQALDVSSDYLKSIIGEKIVTIDDLLTRGMHSGEISRFILEIEHFRDWFKNFKMSREGLEQLLLMRRFTINQGSIFTYRDSLCLRLNDMDIGSKVPMSLLRPPYDTCYFEFGPAETRENSPYKIFCSDRFYILEGAYVSYFESVSKDILSEKGYQILDIEKDKPMRCLEISFTASPITMMGNQKTVLSDVGTYISVFWTNDDLTIDEVLQKHFKLLQSNKSIPLDMVNSIKENMVLLSKAILYLVSGNRPKIEEKVEENLSRRLVALKNPAKVRKLLKHLNTSYDRVVIGPDKKYVPLSERIDRVLERVGVKPHIRRAHWSTRWSGPKKTVLKPVLIEATIVNAQGISDDDLSLLKKDYDVK